MTFFSSSKNVGKRDTFTVLVNGRCSPQTAVTVCRADLSSLDLVVGICGTLQRTSRWLLDASEVLEVALANRIEVQLLCVTAACPETSSVANGGSTCFEQVTGVLVELKLGCRGGRGNKAGVAHLSAANGNVLTSANSYVE